MPPWNQMTPQQQQMLLQMMMSRGTAGMQFPAQHPPNPYGAGQQLPAMGGIQTAPGFNPLANQAQQMNPAMLQYLLGMQGGVGGGMQSPTLAQLLQMRGTGMGL